MDTGAFCDLNAASSPPKISDSACNMCGVLLHYLFTCHFNFLFIESLHNYFLYTYLTVEPILKRWQIILLGFGLPLIPVGVTAALFFDGYRGEESCWINYNRVNAFIEIGVIAILTVIATVTSEATGWLLSMLNPMIFLGFQKKVTQ